MPDRIGVTGWQARAERALDVELAPSFAARDRRGNHPASGPVRMRTGGNAASEKDRQNIVSTLLICGKQTIFAYKRHIAESVGYVRVVVFEVWRNIEEQFHSLIGNQFQSLAVAEVR